VAIEGDRMRAHKVSENWHLAYIPWNLECSRKLDLCRDATFLRMYVWEVPMPYGRGMRMKRFIPNLCQVPTLPCTCMNENWRREKRDNNSTQTQQYTTITGLRPDCDCLVARACVQTYVCMWAVWWVGRWSVGGLCIYSAWHVRGRYLPMHFFLLPTANNRNHHGIGMGWLRLLLLLIARNARTNRRQK
jgi:hypothetical protein